MTSFLTILLGILGAAAAVLGTLAAIRSLIDSIRKNPVSRREITTIIAAFLIAVVMASLLAAVRGQAGGQSPLGGVSATGNATATDTATTLPTNTPLPTATSTPPGPPCNPGAVCYTADWSHGINSWGASGDWKVSNGLLVNDGSNLNDCHNTPTLTLPYQPTTSNYSIVVQAQFPNLSGSNSCFTMFARAGQTNGQPRSYFAFVGGNGSESICVLNSDNCGNGSKCCYAAGSAWHTYTLNVKDTNLNLYIDGGLVVSTHDATLLGVMGQIGLANDNDLLYIRSIVVKGL